MIFAATAKGGIWNRLTGHLTGARPFLTAFIVLAVLTLAWTAARHLIDEVSYNDIVQALSATPSWAIAAALALTGVSFAALCVYDLDALEFVGAMVPKPVIALTSFCAYAVGNTAGFGPLTAGAIRYRFYTPHGVEPGQVARIVAFVTLAFGLGLAGVTGISLLIAANDLSSVPLPPIGLRLAGGGIVLGLLLLWAAAGRGRVLNIFSLSIHLPSRGILIRQFLATSVDVSASAAVLWVLLPSGSIGLPAFITIYAVAIGLGVLSHIPAGLGVFETVIVAALSPHLSMENVLSALVLYRVIYHMVPLALAALLVAGLEIRRGISSPLFSSLLGASGRLTPPVLGAFALVLGAMLIFSGVTPTSDDSLDLLSTHLPLPLVEGAHFIVSVLGMVMLLIARGLVYRLDGAWWAAIVVVPTSILLCLLKGLAMGEAVLLGLLFCALLAARGEFSRQASLLHQTLTPSWLIAVATLLVTALALLLFVYKDVVYDNELWWQFEFSEHAPRSLRALMGIMLAAGFAASWSLLRPAAQRRIPPSPADLDRALAIAAAQSHADAGLVAMGDKSLLFSEDGRAFIMYGRQGRSWVALGDPVGPRDCWPALIWRFAEYARTGGGRVVFYQVSGDNLSFYADIGLRAFKLGEEAIVHLADFDLKGPKRANMRAAINRAEREGVEFAILSQEEIDAHMAELFAVSESWMAHHKVREKRFSLGAFVPAYIRAHPVAVLRQNGRILAFASLLTTDLTEEASIDLMRFLPDAFPNVMEVLLARLILHFKELGYDRFTLGMAPLSGLSDSEAAPMWHRVGRVVFEHGRRFYNFAGLRGFKAKFQPTWRPRYLAVSGGANPMLALADITVLISGGLKGVIGK